MYSDHWIDTFLSPHTEEKTRKEISFIRTIIPPAGNDRILDLCCGNGRHLVHLQELYRSVVGIDASEHALRQAASRIGSNVTLKLHDMRKLPESPDRFNAVLVLWQSFGYYSPAENLRILSDIRNLLLDGGSLLLDLYNLDFFREHTGLRTISLNGETILETSRLDGDLLTVRLSYSSIRKEETFRWQLYSPSGITKALESSGFQDTRIYADFDRGKTAGPTEYKMQVHCRT